MASDSFNQNLNALNGQNAYDILRVSRNATEDELKKAYRAQSKAFHPDRNPGDKVAEIRYKKVQEAWALVEDPTVRAEYDRYAPRSDPKVAELYDKTNPKSLMPEPRSAIADEQILSKGNGNTVEESLAFRQTPEFKSAQLRDQMRAISSEGNLSKTETVEKGGWFRGNKTVDVLQMTGTDADMKILQQSLKANGIDSKMVATGKSGVTTLEVQGENLTKLKSVMPTEIEFSKLQSKPIAVTNNEPVRSVIKDNGRTIVSDLEIIKNAQNAKPGVAIDVKQVAEANARQTIRGLHKDGMMVGKNVGGGFAVEFVAPESELLNLQKTLKAAGIDSTIRESGTEGGRKTLQVKNYQVSLLDKIMPAELGDDVIEKLPQESRTAAQARDAQKAAEAKKVNTPAEEPVRKPTPVVGDDIADRVAWERVNEPDITKKLGAMHKEGMIAGKIVGADKRPAVQFVAPEAELAVLQQQLKAAGIDSTIRPSGTEGGRNVLQVMDHDTWKLAKIMPESMGADPAERLSKLPNESRTAAQARDAQKANGKPTAAVVDDVADRVAWDKAEDGKGKPATKPISATPDDIADRVAWDKAEDGKGKPATKPISATPDDIADRVAWDKVEDGKVKPTTKPTGAPAVEPPPPAGTGLKPVNATVANEVVPATTAIAASTASNPNLRTAASTRASVANGGGGAVGIIFGAKQLSDGISQGDTGNVVLGTANLGSSAAIVGAEVQAARAGLAGAEGLASGGASAGSRALGTAGKIAGKAAIPLAVVSIGYDAYKEEGTGADDKVAYKAARIGVGTAALAIGIGAAAIVGSIFTGGASLALLPVAAGVVAGGGAAVAGNYAVDKHKEGRIKDKQDAAAAEAEKVNAEKRAKFKEAIDQLDKNKDGKVDMADLDPKGKGGISIENYANKDGVFDRKQLELMRKDIAAIGVIADQTKDEGFVKLRDEMTKMSSEAEVELTKIEKATTIARLDKNKDGKVDIADFSKDGAVSIDKSRYTTAAKFDEKSAEVLRSDVKLLEAAAKENAELNPALEKMKALAATAEMDVASVMLDKDKNGTVNKQDFVVRSVVNGQEEINWEKYANSDKKIDFTSLAAMKKDLAALELMANGNPEMASVRDLMKKAVAENEKFLLENEPKRFEGDVSRDKYVGKDQKFTPEALEKLRRDVDALDALSETNSKFVKARDTLRAIYETETAGQGQATLPPDQTINAIANGQVTPAGAATAGSVVSPDATSAGVAGTVVSAAVGGTGDTQPNRFAAQAATTTVAQSVPGTAVGGVVSGRA